MTKQSLIDENSVLPNTVQAGPGSPHDGDMLSPNKGLTHTGLAGDLADLPPPHISETAIRSNAPDTPQMLFDEFTAMFDAALAREASTASSNSATDVKPETEPTVVEPEWKRVPKELRIRGEDVPGMPYHKWGSQGFPVFKTAPPNAGRKKGSRQKLALSFFQDVYDEWERVGADVVKRAAFQDPVKFLDIVAKLMPAKIEIKDTTFEELDRDTAADLIERIRRARQRRIGPDDAGGTGASGKIIDITPRSDGAQ